jgi:hypothetical protein
VLALWGDASTCWARTWTNDNGITLEGALAGIREGEIDLLLQDGRVVSIPRPVLSGSDEEYVAEWERRLSDGEVLPTPDPNEIPQEPTASSQVVPTNWMSPWPRVAGGSTAVAPKLVQQQPDLVVYETPHFRWESPKTLTNEELEYLSGAMESSLSVLAALPMNLRLALDPPAHYVVRIYFDPDEWKALGGEHRERVKVEETHFMIFLKRNAQGKPEELSGVRPLHMVSHWVFQFLGSTYWLNEGMACYLDALPRTKLTLSFKDDLQRVAYTLPRSIRKGSIALPPLQAVMTQQGTPRADEKTRLRYEAAAVIVSTYFTRLEDHGERRHLRKYLQEVQRGNANPTEILLDSRTWKQLEGDIAKAWKKYGVIVRFEADKAAEKPADK